MVIDKRLKIGVFYPPKTGSTSLFKLLQNYTLNQNSRSHNNYEWFSLYYGNVIDQYKFFAFYREPVDRLFSSIKFIQQKLNKEKYGNYSIDEMISLFDSYYEEYKWMLRPQTYWLDYPNITLLNFHKFDEETEKILTALELERVVEPGVVNPRLNVTKETSYKTKKLIEFAQNNYKNDYDFFKSRGIQFT